MITLNSIIDKQLAGQGFVDVHVDPGENRQLIMGYACDTFHRYYARYASDYFTGVIDTLRWYDYVIGPGIMDE